MSETANGTKPKARRDWGWTTACVALDIETIQKVKARLDRLSAAKRERVSMSTYLRELIRVDLASEAKPG